VTNLFCSIIKITYFQYLYFEALLPVFICDIMFLKYVNTPMRWLNARKNLHSVGQRILKLVF
jgi:hypothetical protein